MRITPTPANTITPSQRALHEAFTERIQKNYSQFHAIREDGALLGPWAVWVQVPRTGEAIRQVMEAVAAMRGISAKSSQVISLFTAAHFGAAFEIRVHSTIGVGLGLSEEQLEKLTKREIPSDLDGESTTSVQLADALLTGGIVPDALFRHAVEMIGVDGVNRVVFQVGLYCLVSMTLNAFDIPAPS